MNENITLTFLDVPVGQEKYITVPLNIDRLGFVRIIESYFDKHPTWTLTGVTVFPGKTDTVTVTCYGQTKNWWRPDALAFFRAGIDSSEGAERDRYVNIVRQLESGCSECSDERSY